MKWNRYYECPNCGAVLDPGERCDCQDKKEEEAYAETNDTRNIRDNANTDRSCLLSVAG